jgi:hypothetical protein
VGSSLMMMVSTKDVSSMGALERFDNTFK